MERSKGGVGEEYNRRGCKKVQEWLEKSIGGVGENQEGCATPFFFDHHEDSTQGPCPTRPTRGSPIIKVWGEPERRNSPGMEGGRAYSQGGGGRGVKVQEGKVERGWG